MKRGTQPKLPADSLKLAAELHDVPAAREHRPGSKIPIILLTGFSTLFSADKAKLYGIMGSAMKPIIKKDITNIIRKVLEGDT